MKTRAGLRCAFRVRAREHIRLTIQSLYYYRKLCYVTLRGGLVVWGILVAPPETLGDASCFMF